MLPQQVLWPSFRLSNGRTLGTWFIGFTRLRTLFTPRLRNLSLNGWKLSAARWIMFARKRVEMGQLITLLPWQPLTVRSSAPIVRNSCGAHFSKVGFFGPCFISENSFALYTGYKCTICEIAVHKQCIASVRSCGAPSLPPRPPLSSPSVASCASTDDDNFRNSCTDMRRLNGSFRFSGNGSPPLSNRVRAVSAFDGDSATGQLSFVSDDVITVTSRSAENDPDGLWWEGKNQRTGKWKWKTFIEILD